MQQVGKRIFLTEIHLKENPRHSSQGRQRRQKKSRPDSEQEPDSQNQENRQSHVKDRDLRQKNRRQNRRQHRYHYRQTRNLTDFLFDGTTR